MIPREADRKAKGTSLCVFQGLGHPSVELLPVSGMMRDGL